jgi:hypothetical protein
MDNKGARTTAFVKKDAWIKKKRKKGFQDGDEKKGLTLTELVLIISVIVAFFVGGAVFFKVTSKSAYDITVKHDLQKFADFQDYYYKLNNRCIGEQGQSIRNDGVPSDLPIENYTVSEGVFITIIAGDPANPNDPDNPYLFQAKHEKSDKVYEYNFQSGKMMER